MAIVRSVDGTFYEVPDGELEQYKVPPDQVKGLMEGAGQQVPSGPQQQQQQTGKPMGEASAGSPQILVQFIVQGNQAPQQPAAAQKPPAGAEEEKVEPQNFYWVNWYNWSNWYNWY
jgi:hypothetical protein